MPSAFSSTATPCATMARTSRCSFLAMAIQNARPLLPREDSAAETGEGDPLEADGARPAKCRERPFASPQWATIVRLPSSVPCWPGEPRGCPLLPCRNRPSWLSWHPSIIEYEGQYTDYHERKH